MVVRLQTAEGKIKTYETIEGTGEGEYGPDKYIAKCGREWKEKPKPQDECDHLDCAIYLAETSTTFGLVLFMGTIGIAPIEDSD